MPKFDNGPTVSEDVDRKIAHEIGLRAHDFNKLVDFIFPWGTGKLKFPPYNKPKRWQREVLAAISKHREECRVRRALGLDTVPFRCAVSSGHGVGKSALVAWIIQCFMAVEKDCRGVVTANTASQLETKTWPELSKWHAMSIVNHWFQWTASTFTFKPYPEERRKNYMFNAATVSEENSEAFAGLHNVGSVAVIIFDEASGIPEILYQIADGVAAAGTEFYFLAFGNPTRPDGPFFDCFYKYGGMFQMLKFLDNRDVEGTNQIAQQQIIDKYGEDSDEVKIRVKGQFPSRSFSGFIGIDVVNEAINREVFHDEEAPIVIGVDVARFGDDETCIRVRQGRNARTVHPKVVIPYGRTTEVTREVAKLFDKLRADAIVVEGVGPGAGVIDQLAELGYPVHEVHPNARSSNPKRFGNMRAEWWSDLRDWISGRGCIDDDPDLVGDLTAMKYSISDTTNGRGSGLYMQPKAQMKADGLPSPDDGDSLALTFAVKPARRNAGQLPNRQARVRTSEPIA